MRNLQSRLTFSNVVALLALFISLGAGAYAASKINGKQIKKSSIAGKKLKPDTLTGKQINESTLGSVSNAQHADVADSATTAGSAQTAADAQTLAGTGPAGFVASGDIKRIRFDVTTQSNTPTQQTLLELGPLKLTASCDFAQMFVSASTTATQAGWDVGYVGYDSIADEPIPVSDGGGLGSAQTVVLQAGTTNNQYRYVGNFLYNDATTTISVPFILYWSNSNPGATRCFFTGTATRSTG
jgi:hypothetical protein